jgi:hypothetical protein
LDAAGAVFFPSIERVEARLISVNENEEKTMKRALIAIAGLTLAAATWVAAAQVDLGISVSDGRLRSFYLAVGDHYRVDPRVVVEVRSRYRLLDEELPVVYFLAARAHVAPQAVIDLRLGRMSWLDVALRLRLSPDIFFVPLRAERIGPPYGNAYGYYWRRGRFGDWRGLALADREVVDLVNLRFMSEYHGLAPDEIVGLRGRSKSFVGVHDEIGRGKGRGVAAKDGKSPKGPAGPSKAKGKKK